MIWVLSYDLKMFLKRSLWEDEDVYHIMYENSDSHENGIEFDFISQGNLFDKVSKFYV